MTELNREIQKREAETEKGVERTRAKRIFTPAVDILEKKDEIILTGDMPGVDEKSVDVTLEKNILTIYGKVQQEVSDGYRPIVSEYGVGDYQRVFTLSDEIDSSGIKASVRNGVLRLSLPKAETVMTRKIAVSVED